LWSGRYGCVKADHDMRPMRLGLVRPMITG
jgi:hypothetical protein